MLDVLRKTLGEYHKIPQLYRRLVSKCAWWCVRHDRNPAEFDIILSKESSYDMFEAAGEKMGIKLDYEEELGKILELEDKMKQAEKVVEKMKAALVPPFTGGQLKCKYINNITKIAWYCFNNGLNIEDSIKGLSQLESIYELEDYANETKHGTARFLGFNCVMRSKKEHARILSSYKERMSDEGVPENIRPLVFGMLASGRSIYTGVRSYSREIIEAASYIRDMEKPLEVWNAAENLKYNIIDEVGFRPALLEFAYKMVREYPKFSGDNAAGFRDYFAASGQFKGLSLTEASKRKFLPNRVSFIARHLACNLADCPSATPDLIRLAKMTAQATKNMPIWSLFIELDLFNGKTLQGAIKGFDKLITQGQEIRGSRMFVGMPNYFRYDPDRLERDFQKKALARAGADLIRANVTLPLNFIADRKHSIPENFVRDVREYLAEVKRSPKGPEVDLAR